MLMSYPTSLAVTGDSRQAHRTYRERSHAESTAVPYHGATPQSQRANQAFTDTTPS